MEQSATVKSEQQDKSVPEALSREQLQQKLLARDKTLLVLKQQLAKRQEQVNTSTPLDLLEQNSTMARVVELKTEELENERAQLKQTLDELHQTQAQLLQAQKMESIGQLAAGIAHEINTPTQYVSDNVSFTQSAVGNLFKLIDSCVQFSDSVREHPDCAQAVSDFETKLKRTKLDFLREQIPDALEQSLEGLERIAHIVSAMKEFSHPSRGVKEPINITELIDTTLTVARNEWKYVADLETRYDSTLPPVPCLRNEFGQTVLNLVVNAAHAIEESNPAKGRDKGHIVISATQTDGFFELRVSDDGGGIPEDIKDKIFDPFLPPRRSERGPGRVCPSCIRRWSISIRVNSCVSPNPARARPLLFGCPCSQNNWLSSHEGFVC